MPLPPIDEQRTIVKGINSETTYSSKSLDVVKHEIELLQAYRTRLIADVVIGKLDVREFASTLPTDIAEAVAELADSELVDEDFSEADEELVEEPA